MPNIGLLNGKLFDYHNPDPALIDLETIATVSRRIPRFGGHSTRVVSVCEHHLRVERIVLELVRRGHDLTLSNAASLYALLHDAHEVYTPWGDITDGKTDYMRAVEHAIDDAIAVALGFEPPSDEVRRVVKEADRIALYWEAQLWAPSVKLWTDLVERTPTVERMEILIAPEPGEDWLSSVRDALRINGAG